MCQSSAYIVKGDEKELLMEDVSEVIPEEKGLTLLGLMGQEKHVDAQIKRMDLMGHEILLEKEE